MDLPFAILAILNIIIAALATLGYFIRLRITIKYKEHLRGRCLLILYAVSSASIFVIFVLIFTGWYQLFADDLSTFSIIYIRPFFTFLATLFAISCWTHPELQPYTKKIKEWMWLQIHRLTGWN